MYIPQIMDGHHDLTIDEIAHQFLSEIQRHLRYQPTYYGRFQVVSYVEQGKLVGYDVTSVRVVSKPRPVPEWVDKGETNQAGMKRWANLFKAKYARQPAECYGTISGLLHFRDGTLIRYEALGGERHLQPYQTEE